MSTGELNGKVAVVTGGSRGIGRAICKALADGGARVAVVARNPEGAVAAAEALGDAHRGYGCDVADPEQVRATVAAVESEVGPVDILVNNAGITRDNILLRMKDEEFDEVIATNLKGTFNLIRAVTRGMMKRRAGCIVNISSVVGLIGNTGQANYAASKAGMHGFSMALAQEVARKGVTVNTVSPGYIATDMVMAVPEDIRNKIVAQIPVGRLGTPEEVAYLVDFLCSDKAGFITGADISANGGQHMM